MDMDMLQKIMEEKMKKGVHSSSDEESPSKKTAQLGILAHISKMAEDAMADDMKNHLGHNTSGSEPGSGMEKGVTKAESMMAVKGKPLHTDDFDADEMHHHGGAEDEGAAHESSPAEESEDEEESHHHAAEGAEKEHDYEDEEEEEGEY